MNHDDRDSIASKPRSQQLLEEACVLIKDEALSSAALLVEAARFDIELLLANIDPATTTGLGVRHEIKKRFDRLSHALEML